MSVRRVFPPTHARLTAPARQQRGAALLLAMVIVVLVSAVTASMLWQQSRAVEIESAQRGRDQMAAILHGALDWTRLILRADLDSDRRSNALSDHLGEGWALELKDSRLSSFLAADKDNNSDIDLDAFLSGKITDAQAKWNLRALVDDGGKIAPLQLLALQRLCVIAGLPDNTASRIAQGMQAALMPPGTEVAGVRSDPATAPLRPARFADLAWLGIEAAILSSLERWVDLLPVPTPVNLNTAEAPAIVAAIDGIDAGTAQRLVDVAKSQPFKTLDEVKARLAPDTALDPSRVSVNSSWFMVEGTMRLGDRLLRERSLLARRDGRVDVVRRERLSFASASN